MMEVTAESHSPVCVLTLAGPKIVSAHEADPKRAGLWRRRSRTVPAVAKQVLLLFILGWGTLSAQAGSATLRTIVSSPTTSNAATIAARPHHRPRLPFGFMRLL